MPSVAWRSDTVSIGTFKISQTIRREPSIRVVMCDIMIDLTLPSCKLYFWLDQLVLHGHGGLPGCSADADGDADLVMSCRLMMM